MADALGLAASIVSILQLSDLVVRYFIEVKSASKDCDAFILEISATSGVLGSLEKLIGSARVKDAEQWLPTVCILSAAGGPLDIYRVILRRIEELLEPSVRLFNLSNRLVWPFKHKEVLKLLEKIQRQHSIFNLALISDHVQLSHAIRDDLQDVRTRVNIVREELSQLNFSWHENELRRLSQQREEVLSWLSQARFRDIQNQTLERRQEGSGEWFLNHSKFVAWTLGEEQILWCPAGAGKTVMASIIVERLEQLFSGSNNGIAYVYCSYREQNQSARQLMGSILQQLAWQNQVLSEGISKLHERHSSHKSSPSLKDISMLLFTECIRFERTFIVIDALDEFSESEDAHECFLQAILNSVPNLRLLVTSREIATIANELGNPPRLEISATPTDVENYVLDGCRTSLRLKKHCHDDPSLQEDILDTIMRNHDGMFLYARLYMQSLSSLRVRKDLRALLRNPPYGLSALYDQAMSMIGRQSREDRSLANRIISWTTFADCSLTVEQMQHLLAMDLAEDQLDEDAIPTEETLTAVCAGLIRIEWREQYRNYELDKTKSSTPPKIVKLVHFTAQTYFQDRSKDFFPTWQPDAVRLSLHALKLEYRDYPEDPVPTTKIAYHGWPKRRSPLPPTQGSAFFDHALKFLTSKPEKHLDIQSADLPGRACDVFSTPGVARQIMEDIHWRLRKLQVDCFYLDTRSKLASSIPLLNMDFSKSLPHLAACLGFEKTLKRSLLLPGPQGIDERDNYGLTALTYATIAGAPSTVRMLIDMGASVPESCAVLNPLEFIVAMPWKIKTVDVWLGIRNLPKVIFYHALLRAIRYGRVTIISRMLDGATDLYPEDDLNYEALLFAIELGNRTLITYLILRERPGWDKPRNGETLLFNAVRARKLASVQALLGRGIDINARNRHGEHALFSAAQQNDLEIASYLVEEGADLQMRSRRGLTATHILLASLLTGSVVVDTAICKSAAQDELNLWELILSSKNPFELCSTKAKRSWDAEEVTEAESLEELLGELRPPCLDQLVSKGLLAWTRW